MAAETGNMAEGESTQEKLKPYERKLGNWIRAYLEFTAESESPESYHLWAGISAIASAVRRNVWLDQGLYVLFPNLFIAFIGPPARTAKSTALYLQKGIINTIPGIKMGPAACSREELIRTMAESKFDNQCALTIHSSELSDLIDTSGILMIQFLTTIYDGNYVDAGGWNYNTKHQGKDKIVNPFLNLIFGTTPSYFADSMPENIIGHGFTSRTIIVFEEKERHRNSRPRANNDILAQALKQDLAHISRIRGEFHWGGEVIGQDKDGKDITTAMQTYDTYYDNLFNTVPLDHRLEGFHWRKKTHVLKVAMLLSLAERDDLTITSQDINAAVQFLHDLEPAMARAFSAVGRNEFASIIERIGSQVRLAGEISMEDIYGRHYSAGSAYELDNVIQTLEKMGVCKRVTKLVKGEPVIYLKSPNGAKAKALPWSTTKVGLEVKVEGEPGHEDHLDVHPDQENPLVRAKDRVSEP